MTHRNPAEARSPGRPVPDVPVFHPLPDPDRRRPVAGDGRDLAVCPGSAARAGARAGAWAGSVPAREAGRPGCLPAGARQRVLATRGEACGRAAGTRAGAAVSLRAASTPGEQGLPTTDPWLEKPGRVTDPGTTQVCRHLRLGMEGGQNPSGPWPADRHSADGPSPRRRFDRHPSHGAFGVRSRRSPMERALCRATPQCSSGRRSAQVNQVPC